VATVQKITFLILTHIFLPSVLTPPSFSFRIKFRFYFASVIGTVKAAAEKNCSILRKINWTSHDSKSNDRSYFQVEILRDKVFSF
jgi:hypothetical protein